MFIRGGSFKNYSRGFFASIVLIVSVGLLFSAFIPLDASAQPIADDPNLNLEGFEEASGLSGEPLTLIIARIIRAFFGLLGIAAVGYFTYGGFVWMTAGGDVGKVDEAKKIMVNATIGLAIMLSSFAIASFIIRALVGATTGGVFDTSGAGGQIPPGFVGGAALGQSIEYVIPEPEATDVFRNTGILVQFKKHIVAETLLEDIDDSDPNNVVGDLNVNNVLIYKTDQGPNSALTSDSVHAVLSQVKLDSGVTSLLSMTLKDGALFGSPTEDTQYTVKIGVQIKALNDAQEEVPVFASLDGYSWNFTVGTKVDLDPPYITSLYPSVDSEDNFRNVNVLVQFNKSMMPTTILTGNNLTVTDGGAVIDGTWVVSNKARTAEFHTNEECGKSACGDVYYCFEPNITVDLAAHPGDVDEAAGAPKATVPYNGLVSLTGNSFDGNGDGVAQGPEVDISAADQCAQELAACVLEAGEDVDAQEVCEEDHASCQSDSDGSIDPRDTKRWSFGIGETIDVWSPYIEVVAPGLNQSSSVAVDQLVSARFDEVILPSSIGKARIDQPTNLAQWYIPFSENLDVNNQVVTKPDAVAHKSILLMSHADFLESTDDTIYSYKPAFTQGILDAQKNCFVPGHGPSHADTAGKELTDGCKYEGQDAASPYCCNGKKSADPKKCAADYQNLQPVQ